MPLHTGTLAALKRGPARDSCSQQILHHEQGPGHTISSPSGVLFMDTCSSYQSSHPRASHLHARVPGNSRPWGLHYRILAILWLPRWHGFGPSTPAYCRLLITNFWSETTAGPAPRMLHCRHSVLYRSTDILYYAIGVLVAEFPAGVLRPAVRAALTCNMPDIFIMKRYP